MLGGFGMQKWESAVDCRGARASEEGPDMSYTGFIADCYEPVVGVGLLDRTGFRKQEEHMIASLKS